MLNIGEIEVIGLVKIGGKIAQLKHSLNDKNRHDKPIYEYFNTQNQSSKGNVNVFGTWGTAKIFFEEKNGWVKSIEVLEVKQNKIVDLRAKLNLTQTQLALKIGVTQKDISRWETGERNPNVQNLKKLSEVLNCKIEDLI